jgi:hypothetical protein
MKNPTLEKIKLQIIAVLSQKYGYCGLADGDHIAILNSGGDGEDFVITIKDDSPLKLREDIKISGGGGDIPS